MQKLLVAAQSKRYIFAILVRLRLETCPLMFELKEAHHPLAGG
jgi:hypothetical protein